MAAAEGGKGAPPVGLAPVVDGKLGADAEGEKIALGRPALKCQLGRRLLRNAERELPACRQLQTRVAEGSQAPRQPCRLRFPTTIRQGAVLGEIARERCADPVPDPAAAEEGEVP